MNVVPRSVINQMFELHGMTEDEVCNQVRQLSGDDEVEIDENK